MTQMASGRTNRLVLVGEMLVLIVSLPFVLVLVALARPLMMIAALVSLGLSTLSASLRSWLATTLQYKGLRLASDVGLHAGHSWVRIFPRHMTVGADDLMQRALGPVQEVKLPKVGQRVVKGERLFTLRRAGRTVEVGSPVTGTVLALNESLREQPGRINEAPFQDGWVVQLRADRANEARRSLFSRTRAVEWFRSEVDRLIASLHAEEGIAACLPDGGMLVDDLYRQIDDRAWEHLTESFFSGTSQTS